MVRGTPVEAPSRSAVVRMSSLQSLVLVVLVFALATLITTLVTFYLEDLLDWLRRRRGQR